MVYAGIGSRETPEEFLDLMRVLGREMAQKGHTLRSGGAEGADSAFESGCDDGNGEKEIYLPWKGFEGNKSNLFNVSETAMDLAGKFHPIWDTLSQGAKKLHARNVYQVLGLDLETPANWIICWTKNGKPTGGTGQALRIAKCYGVPVLNLGSYKTIGYAYEAFKAEVLGEYN